MAGLYPSPNAFLNGNPERSPLRRVPPPPPRGGGGGSRPQFPRFPKPSWFRGGDDAEQIDLDKFKPTPSDGFSIQKEQYPFLGGQTYGESYYVQIRHRYRTYPNGSWIEWRLSSVRLVNHAIYGFFPDSEHSLISRFSGIYAMRLKADGTGDRGGTLLTSYGQNGDLLEHEVEVVQLYRKDGTSQEEDVNEGGNPAPTQPEIRSSGKNPVFKDGTWHFPDGSPMPSRPARTNPSPARSPAPAPALDPPPLPKIAPLPDPDPAPAPFPDPDPAPAPFPDPDPAPFPDPDPSPIPSPDPFIAPGLIPLPSPIPLPLPSPIPDSGGAGGKKTLTPKSKIPILEKQKDDLRKITPIVIAEPNPRTTPETDCQALQECLDIFFKSKKSPIKPEPEPEPIIYYFVLVNITQQPLQSKIFNPSTGGTGENVLIAGYLRWTVNGNSIGTELEIRRASQAFQMPEWADGWDLYPCHGALLSASQFSIEL